MKMHGCGRMNDINIMLLELELDEERSVNYTQNIFIYWS
jgi:hypothetical protein